MKSMANFLKCFLLNEYIAVKSNFNFRPGNYLLRASQTKCEELNFFGFIYLDRLNVREYPSTLSLTHTRTHSQQAHTLFLSLCFNSC
jgi:hypothetical protein